MYRGVHSRIFITDNVCKDLQTLTSIPMLTNGSLISIILLVFAPKAQATVRFVKTMGGGRLAEKTSLAPGEPRRTSARSAFAGQRRHCNRHNRIGQTPLYHF